MNEMITGADFALIWRQQWENVLRAQRKWQRGLEFREHRTFALSDRDIVQVEPRPIPLQNYSAPYIRYGVKDSNQPFITYKWSVLQGTIESSGKEIDFGPAALKPIPLPTELLRYLTRLGNVAQWIERAGIAAEKHHEALLNEPKQRDALSKLHAVLAEAKLGAGGTIANARRLRVPIALRGRRR